jgi:hypothetical protein
MVKAGMARGKLMTAKASRNRRLPQVDDPEPDLAIFIMARAMAEVFQGEPDCPMPEPLTAILRRMECWEDEHEQDAA